MAEGEVIPPELQKLIDLDASLTYDHGTVELAGGRVRLEVPDGFGYLDPKETNDVIVAWGNLPSPDTLGSLFPTGISPFANNSWGAILNYMDDGHVSDEDAAEIDYDGLLKEMQADDADENRQRQALGLESIRLAGWAAPPRYDALGHKLHWAKRLTAAGGESLNYDIRILGREGVLSVQAVASMADMAAVETGMAQVLGFASFTQGNRYEDYDPSTDRLAEAGLAALVFGGAASAASKGGVFKALLAGVLAFKKALIPVAIGFFVLVKSLFTRKRDAVE